MIRAITEYHWDSKRNKISSALFKTRGCSVDRKGSRNLQKALKVSRSKPLSKPVIGVALLKVEEVRKNNCDSFYDPVFLPKMNWYHSIIEKQGGGGINRTLAMGLIGVSEFQLDPEYQ